MYPMVPCSCIISVPESMDGTGTKYLSHFGVALADGLRNGDELV